jgi:mono/diheme cytochrome c family protein
MRSMFTFATIVFFSFAVNAMAGLDAKNIDAAALYNKHCQGCHHDASKLRTDADIVESMRDPLPAMPRFDRDKINDRDALAIADFIRQGARDIKKAPQPEVASSAPVMKTAQPVTVEPEQKPVASKAIIADPTPIAEKC